MGGAAVLVKFQRGGLANRLFPWARGRIYSELHGLPMLGVRWEQLKVGPLLRRESDARLYLGLFRQAPEAVVGLRLISSLISFRRGTEPADLSVPPPPDERVVVFSGLGDLFVPLLEHRKLIAKSLFEVSRPLKLPTDDQLLPIVCHIRLGDFHRVGLATDPRWFAATLKRMRAAGIDDPVGIVSDGSDEELRPVLEIDNVRTIRCGNALGDLWAAASAGVLIASSGSTFSAWATYLGQSVTAYAPGGNMVGLESRSGVDRPFLGPVGESACSSDFIAAAERGVGANWRPLLRGLRGAAH